MPLNKLTNLYYAMATNWHSKFISLTELYVKGKEYFDIDSIKWILILRDNVQSLWDIQVNLSDEYGELHE